MTATTKSRYRDFLVWVIPIVIGIVTGIASGAYAAGRVLERNEARITTLEKQSECQNQQNKELLDKLNSLDKRSVAQGKDIEWIRKTVERMDSKLNR